MSSLNFKKAVDILAKKRQQVDYLMLQRYNEVVEKTPRIEKITTELAQTNIKLSKIIFSKNTNDFNKIKSENLLLQNEMKKLLFENDYPFDYLRPHYSCEICDDTGYIDGKKCSCLKNLITNLNIEDFNNSAVISPKKFEEFSLKYYSDISETQQSSPKKTMQEILHFCEVYSNKFNVNSPSILMMGETGLGKTHLSLSIADEITHMGFVAMYSSALDLFRTLQNEYYGKGEYGKNTMQTILQADLVIIDDLGAEFESSFNNSALYNIINSRLNVNRPIIISTNLTSQQIELKYSNRVASRVLTLYKCLKFVGKDIRQIKLRNNEL